MEPEDRNIPDGRDAALEKALAAARTHAPVPEALMARVLADADRVQSGRRAQDAPVAAARAGSGPWGRAGLGRLVQALGGSGAVAGLAVAGLTGVWIGFAQPVPLLVTPGEVVELIPTDDDFWLAMDAEPVPED